MVNENKIRKVVNEVINEMLTESAEVKNRQLRRALEREGMGDVHLYRGDGYFYVGSEERLDPYNDSIYTMKFSDMSVEEWVNNIKELYNNEV